MLGLIFQWFFVSLMQGEICVEWLFFSTDWQSVVLILSADDWVCIFVLFVLWMRHPAQRATGIWVMPGLVYKWLPLWEFSLLTTPQGQFSGSLDSWIQHSHSKGLGLDLWPGWRFHRWFVMALNGIRTNTQKQETKEEPQTNGSYKIRQIIIKIMEYTHIRIHP